MPLGRSTTRPTVRATRHLRHGARPPEERRRPEGHGVMLEVMRNVGRAAEPSRASQRAAAPLEEKKATSSPGISVSRKARRPSAPSAPRLARPRAPRPAAPPTAPGAEWRVVPAGQARGRPPPPSTASAFTADGHLADAKAWTPRSATALAAMQGVALTRHLGDRSTSRAPTSRRPGRRPTSGGSPRSPASHEGHLRPVPQGAGAHHRQDRRAPKPAGCL
jgi:hypothetical protein